MPGFLPALSVQQEAVFNLRKSDLDQVVGSKCKLQEDSCVNPFCQPVGNQNKVLGYSMQGFDIPCKLFCVIQGNVLLLCWKTRDIFYLS